MKWLKLKFMKKKMLQKSQESFEKEKKNISSLDINTDYKTIIIKTSSKMLFL